MLAAFPNWNVDLAARISELGRQPYTARDLLVRWPDRILFGTDAAPDAAAWQTYFRFLETRDESFPYDPDGGPGSQGRWTITGLGLPPAVLRAVYGGNARRLVFPDLPVAATAHRTLHLLPAARWAAWSGAPADSRYEPDAFAADGFVHCTDGADEMVEVANRFYRSTADSFVVLTIDLGALDVPWRYDDPDGTYPHVYGSLPRGAVRAVAPVERGADGRFRAIAPSAPA